MWFPLLSTGALWNYDADLRYCYYIHTACISRHIHLFSPFQAEYNVDFSLPYNRIQWISFRTTNFNKKIYIRFTRSSFFFIIFVSKFWRNNWCALLKVINYKYDYLFESIKSVICIEYSTFVFIQTLWSIWGVKLSLNSANSCKYFATNTFMCETGTWLACCVLPVIEQLWVDCCVLWRGNPWHQIRLPHPNGKRSLTC